MEAAPRYGEAVAAWCNTPVVYVAFGHPISMKTSKDQSRHPRRSDSLTGQFSVKPSGGHSYVYRDAEIYIDTEKLGLYHQCFEGGSFPTAGMAPE